jgi:hypothetical protein
MARKTNKLIHQVQKTLAQFALGVEANLSAAVRQLWLVVVAFNGFGQRVDAIERQAQGFPNIPHRAARSIGRHNGRHACSLAAVLVI